MDSAKNIQQGNNATACLQHYKRFTGNQQYCITTFQDVSQIYEMTSAQNKKKILTVSSNY